MLQPWYSNQTPLLYSLPPSNKKKAAFETARRRKLAMQATRGKATSFTKGITNLNQNGLIFGTTKGRKHRALFSSQNLLILASAKISKANRLHRHPIVKLKPTTDPEAELQGEIFIADLNTAKGPLLRYEAISYTWEGQSPSPNHFIILHCKDDILSRLNLTANTSAALRRVRLPNKVRYIWIDAICIDQSSIKDKERQIANMGFVYSLAQRVLVWLGDHVTRDGLLTLKYIRELAMHCPTDTDSGCQLQRVFDNIREGKPSCLIDVKKAK